jgi:hypothetical protein
MSKFSDIFVSMMSKFSDIFASIYFIEEKYKKIFTIKNYLTF